jgi:hypothetical protein
MKKLFIILSLILAITAQASEYYGFKIGGVAVNSDNYTNVRGTNIKANNENQPYSVVYNPSTKTVTLKNVKIVRTGNDNRCIYNESCDDLTVMFETNDSYLSSTTCAPIRLEANTTFTCEALVRVDVYGTDGDANCLYATDGATVTFDHATFYMHHSGNSNPAISCSSTTDEKIVFRHSRVSVQSANGSALSRFSSVTSDGSALLLRTSSETAYAMSNVKSFTLTGNYTGMTIGYNNSIGSFINYSYAGTATFNASKQTFVNSSSQTLPGKDIIISQRIPINESNFPDVTFRSWLTDKYGSNLETYEIFERRTINIESSGNEVLLNVQDWTGLNYFRCFRRLWDQGGKTRVLRLGSNEFYHLKCYNNPVGIQWGLAISSLHQAPSNKEALIEGFDVTATERNPLPTRSQLGSIKSKGFDFVVKNGNQTYSLNALQDYWPIDYAHFPDDAFRSFLYSRAEGFDAVIYESENATINGFDIKNMNIADLTGIEGLTNIQHLYCHQNNISTLNLSQNSKLTLLYCYWNNIKSEGWDNFIANAPTVSTRLDVYCYFPSGNYENNDLPTFEQVAQAKAKKIYFYRHNGSKWEEMSEIPPTVPGDVNGDGLVTSADITALYSWMLNNDDSSIVNGDQNGDGNITSGDVTVIYDILLGN